MKGLTGADRSAARVSGQRLSDRVRTCVHASPVSRAWCSVNGIGGVVTSRERWDDSIPVQAGTVCERMAALPPSVGAHFSGAV